MKQGHAIVKSPIIHRKLLDHDTSKLYIFDLFYFIYISFGSFVCQILQVSIFCSLFSHGKVNILFFNSLLMHMTCFQDLDHDPCWLLRA